MALKFVYVCDLFESIESLERLHVRLSKQDRLEKRRYLTKQWFDNHRPSIGTSTADLAALLSCLLPARRPDRVYSMKKKRISCCLGFALGLPNEQLMRLEGSADGADLADVAANIVADRATGALPSATVREVDSTFNHLASMSRASSVTVRRGRDFERTIDQRHVLKPLLLKLTSRELRWFLRLAFRQLGLAELPESTVFYHVDPLLLTVMRVRSDFQEALETLNDPDLQQFDRQEPGGVPKHLLRGPVMPKIGTKIGRPYFLKVRSVKDCMRLVGDSTWNVEPKFDGEYCQIHVDISREHDKIRLFSKSGKESTYDRTKLHPFLRDSLRLNDEPRFKQRCILEGEMVVFDNRDMSILPFHTIRKHVSRSGYKLGTEQDSEIQPFEQLGIVYYDVMLIDDDPVMHLSHTLRREKLTRLVKKIDGHATTADWGTIKFRKYSNRSKDAEARLESVFQKCMARRCEGLVLKPAYSPYLPVRLRNLDAQPHAFLKMKADYIPGLGDTADFAVIGALKRVVVDVRADLIHRVKWTHLVLACLFNKDAVLQDKAKPLYKSMAVVDRPAISQDDLLHISAAADPIPAAIGNQDQPTWVTPRFDLISGGAQTSPETLFRHPFIVEVVGSAFERPASTRIWMLRHPRIVKIHGNDRTLEDVVSLDQLQCMANVWLKVPEDQLEEEMKWQQRLHEVTRSKKWREDSMTNLESTQRSATTTNTTPVKSNSLIPETPPSGGSAASRKRLDSAALSSSVSLCHGSTPTSFRTPQMHSCLSPSPIRTKPPHVPTLIRVDTIDGSKIGERYVSTAPGVSSAHKRTRSSTSNITPPRKRTLSGQEGPTRGNPVSSLAAAACGQKRLVAAPSKQTVLTEMDLNVPGFVQRPKSPANGDKIPSETQSSLTSDMTDLFDTPPSKAVSPNTCCPDPFTTLRRHAPYRIPSVLRRTSPFRRDSISIYRPVSMACTLLDKYLLPLFADNKPIVTNLQTWAQASTTVATCTNTLLVVFVDMCCLEESQAVVDELMRTRLGKGMDVQVWDYRILTLFCQCDADDQRQLTAAQMSILLADYLMATVMSRPATADTPAQGSHLLPAPEIDIWTHDGRIQFNTATDESLQKPEDISVVRRRQDFRCKNADPGEADHATTNLLVTGGWYSRQQCAALANLWTNG